MRITWKDYMEGYDNLPFYMKTKYGEGGKYMINQLDTHAPVRLDDKYNTVGSIYDMEFGQFIMAEMAISSGKSQKSILSMLALAVLRPKSDLVFDNTDDKKESENAKKVGLEHAKDVLNECSVYIEKRNKFIQEDFAGVFYKKVEETEEDDEDGIDDSAEQSFEESFNKDWYWYSIANSLADNDILKIETIMMMKMKYIAPHLAYLRMKGVIEHKRRKMQEVADSIRRRR